MDCDLSLVRTLSSVPTDGLRLNFDADVLMIYMFVYMYDIYCLYFFSFCRFFLIIFITVHVFGARTG